MKRLIRIYDGLYILHDIEWIQPISSKNSKSQRQYTYYTFSLCYKGKVRLIINIRIYFNILYLKKK